MIQLIKNVLIILLLTAGVSGSAARPGLSIGIHQSRFIGRNLPGKRIDGIPGFNIGGSLYWPLNSVLTLQNGLALCIKGCRMNTVGDIYLTNIFVYIESPVILRIHFHQKNQQPFLQLGTSLNYNVLAINDVGLIDKIRKWDMGLIGGFGLDLPKLSLAICFNQGLIPIDISESKTGLRHQTLGTSITFVF